MKTYIKTDYVQVGNLYLTKGREYKVLDGTDKWSWIIDDNGNVIRATHSGDIHTCYKPWQVINR